jgi:predicted secreted Zn-dependent protease
MRAALTHHMRAALTHHMRAALTALIAVLIVAAFACGGGGPQYDNESTGIIISPVTTVVAQPSLDAPPLFPPFAPLVNTGTVTSGPLTIGPTPTSTPRVSPTPEATRPAGTPTVTQTPRPGVPVVTLTPAVTPSTASISCSVPANPSTPKVDVKNIDGANGVQLTQRIEYKTYAVSGCNVDDISSSLRSSTNQSSAGRYEVGVTSSTTRYSYKYQEQGGSCRLNGASITSDITVMLPELPNQQGISADTLGRWQAFMAALRTHEQGHVDIILKSAGVIKSTFEGQTQSMPCPQLETTLKGAVQRETDVANTANEAYDNSTNHGVNQGVAFP